MDTINELYGYLGRNKIYTRTWISQCDTEIKKFVVDEIMRELSRKPRWYSEYHLEEVKEEWFTNLPESYIRFIFNPNTTLMVYNYKTDDNSETCYEFRNNGNKEIITTVDNLTYFRTSEDYLYSFEIREDVKRAGYFISPGETSGKYDLVNYDGHIDELRQVVTDKIDKFQRDLGAFLENYEYFLSSFISTFNTSDFVYKYFIIPGNIRQDYMKIQDKIYKLVKEER